MSHPSESGHWYAADGSPVFEIMGKNGKMRPPNVKDARERGLFPGTTSIIQCAAAHGLVEWKITQNLLSALTLPTIEGESMDARMARCRADAKEQAEKARARGTVLHTALQGWFEYRTDTPEELIETCRAVGKMVSEWEALPSIDFDAEKSFAHQLGFGGKVDLHGENWVIDFKSKEFGPTDKLGLWPEQEMQLAAYRTGLQMPEARCAIVYVSVTHPGLARLLEIPEQDLARGWECFKALLAFWQAKSKYYPTKEAVAA